MSEYRTYGWVYALAGGALFIGAALSAADPNETRIRIGALIFGPILAGRGIYLLWRYYDSPERKYPSPPLARNPVELYSRWVQDNQGVSEVTCAGCGQGYVYVPGLAAQVQAEHLGTEVARELGMQAAMQGVALAPCPHCGHIQPAMYACAGNAPFAKPLLLVGILTAFAAALSFAYCISNTLGYDPHKEPPNLAVAWGTFGGLVALAVVALYGSWRLQQRWNPNASRSQLERLRLGQQVSLTREQYEQLRQA